MLNNLTNFFNLIAGRKIKTSTTIVDTDLITLGTRDPNYGGGYQPTAISYEEFVNSLSAVGVRSVTGLDTDNTDPLNPIINIKVDGTTITGDGTSLSPLIAVGPTPSYKVYAASLLQTGTTAPIPTILENTLGTTVTFSYIGVGNYEITFGIVPSFPKVAVLISPLRADSTNWSVYVNKFNFPTKIRLTTRSGGTDANGLLTYAFIEIRVYN
jgi:hypothetical protein